MSNIFDLKHTGIVILVMLNTTKDPDGRSRMDSSLKYGFYSYNGLPIGMVVPLSPSLIEFAKE